MSLFPFVAVNDFSPNNSGWTTVGTIASWSPDASGRLFTFVFGAGAAYSLLLQVLGPMASRAASRLAAITNSYSAQKVVSAAITRAPLPQVKQ